MSELKRRALPAGEEEDDSPGKGPNLVLIYGLLALAMATAIGLALLIVFPFYHRR
ncbi:MAG: hypothetical protein ABSC76_16145 [Terracidiphilus sp.]|jgi:hypothetical protein